jgi:signal transduction histidine kinase
MTLVSSESRRRYDALDLALAEDLGVRAALAIDNARLYMDERRATRARQEVLRVVSHDLKTPLTAIVMSAQRLAKMTLSEGGGTQAADVIATIRRSAQRMARLVDDLLDIERIEAHGLHIEPRKLEASALVADSLESIEPLASTRSIRLRAEVEGARNVIVLCDRERIMQVFANLLGNGIKFAPEGSAVTVCADRKDDEVIFCVRDEGPGMGANELPHVFDRYWQGRGTERLGIGLGLAIAKAIVEAHGGRIWVESDIGKGSTFYFTLRRA